LLKHRSADSDKTGETSMTLQTLIKDKIAEKGSKEIAKQLGYNVTKKFEERVKIVIESPYLSLDSSGYDFHYSSNQFIKKLSEALEIPELFYSRVIEEIEAQLVINNEKKPYFFLETNFKRKSQPVFMLAALESRRYLEINEGIFKLSLNQQLSRLSDFIKTHNQQHPVLELWGKIESYVYFYDEKTIFIFQQRVS